MRRKTISDYFMILKVLKKLLYIVTIKAVKKKKSIYALKMLLPLLYKVPYLLKTKLIIYIAATAIYNKIAIR